jgi:hypothetical protein
MTGAPVRHRGPMIARRQIITLGAAALAAAALPRAARAASDSADPDRIAADQAAERFAPFLIDLPGWVARKPGAIAMKKFGANMTIATREYRRGTAVVTAQITMMQAVWTWRGMLGIKPGRNDPIGEPKVTKVPLYDTFGMVMVTLASDTQFNLMFNGIPSAEAVELARQFDWKAIQAALPK